MNRSQGEYSGPIREEKTTRSKGMTDSSHVEYSTVTR